MDVVWICHVLEMYVFVFATVGLKWTKGKPWDQGPV